ncbi:acyltransferase domain-containing protein (plasmid) [Streptomyces sp. BHT-5-2]|uniref:type I polyketide synthase n=1 Tax=Streptomyces sp. BHT-5-2 TaxID=2866715 RepID=UPI001C8E0620|nr:type I polyketide synthase [Streptomyces sp. BHT-5-2]QZL04211.1 acyltransferase domain-containing protein [Streptomyces sp. BHT-5-2]QZL08171.1 acyltransferase domain-containing protein [Streptomyces sp. BHT-5-2]
MITGQAPARGSAEDAVAVIGMGCRFPQAESVDQYWRLLTDQVDAITEVPGDRFDIAEHYDPSPGTPGKTVSRYGGFLESPFHFDAAFFGISPLEATGMDPQQRLLLQVTWEALEHAGIRPSSLAGSRTGVFVGQATAEYGEISARTADTDVREAAGNRLRAVTAGRVSYTFDLQGPSLVLDTACSSSLVAVHTARRSLLTADCDLAIAAGVNIVLSATDAVAYSQGSMLAPDGRCKFGDARADGFVRSDGIGAVVLKRLVDAERDGDPVLAVLRGSAVVNDGRGSGLLLKPAASGQVAAMWEACISAGITPGQLDYVEAHGTGTRVGDLAELQGLADAVAGERTPERPLRVGSVKTNIGHTEAAAGIAGLIKAVLVARHRLVPGSLHLTTPNPALADGLPVEVVRGTAELTPTGDAAVVGVSSFGIAGTNAHVIVGEYTGGQAEVSVVPAPSETPYLLVLSARSMKSLRRLAQSYASYLEPGGKGRSLSLADVCATAAARRDHHACRLWVVGGTADELADRLRALSEGGEIADGGIAECGFEGPRRIAFVFPGQGSQWLGMGRRLLAESTAFRAAMSACDRAVVAESGWSPLEILTRGREEDLAEMDIVQPLLWAVQISLAAHWRQLGVRPDLCIGHSMGEAAAAYVCGALPLADSAAVICRRSRLMKRLAGRGAMLAVGLSAPDALRVADRYGPAVCVAAKNAPQATVLAGDPEVLGRIEEELVAAGETARRVKVSVASHSPDMDLIRDDLCAALADLAPAAVQSPMLSTVTGALVQGEELSGAYWVDNLRKTVRFVDAVRTAAMQEDTVFIELSPHPVLTHAVEETLAAAEAGGWAVPSMMRDQDDTLVMARALGRLYSHGGDIDWNLWAGDKARPVPLPGYVWDDRPFRSRTEASGLTEVRTVALDSPSVPVSLQGLAPTPPAMIMNAALDTVTEMTGQRFALENTRLEAVSPPLHEDAEIRVRVAVDAPDSDGSRSVTMESLEGAACVTTLRATGRLRPMTGERPLDASKDINMALARCRSYLAPEAFRQLTLRWGYDKEEGSLPITQLWARSGESVAWLRFPQTPSYADLESGLLPLLAALPQAHAGTSVYIPTVFSRVAFHGRLTAQMWSMTRFTQVRGRPPRGDVRLLGPEGHLLAEFQGILLRRLDTGGPHSRGRIGSALAALLSRGMCPDRGPQRYRVTPALPAPHTPIRVPAQRTASLPQQPAGVRDTEAPAQTLLRCLAAIMHSAPQEIEVRRPLRDQGLDSLMAMRLHKLLLAEAGVKIAVGRLLSDVTVAQLMDELSPTLARSPA